MDLPGGMGGLRARGYNFGQFVNEVPKGLVDLAELTIHLGISRLVRRDQSPCQLSEGGIGHEAYAATAAFS